MKKAVWVLVLCVAGFATLNESRCDETSMDGDSLPVYSSTNVSNLIQPESKNIVQLNQAFFPQSVYSYSQDFNASDMPLNWSEVYLGSAFWIVQSRSLNGYGNGNDDLSYPLLYDAHQYSDFKLSCSVRHVNGGGNNGIGLTFRYVTGNGYCLTIKKNLQWMFYKLSSRNATVITTWKYAPELNSEWNQIGIQTTGNTFRFFFNGEFVYAVQDDTYSCGYVGCRVANDAHGQFDNFSIQANDYCDAASHTPAPPQPTFTPSFTPIPTPTATDSPTATSTPTATHTPTATLMPTATPTDSPSPTSTPVPTATPTQTQTPTPSPTSTYTPIPTYTPLPTLTPTSIPTSTPTLTPTLIYTPTPTATPFLTPTFTPQPVRTHTPTSTPIVSFLCTNNFTLQQSLTIQLDSAPTGMITGDFNADGYTDVVTANPREYALYLFESTGNPDTPLIPIPIPLESETGFLSGGDLNGDRKLDICALSFLDEKAVVLLGDTFEERIEIDVPYNELFDDLTITGKRPVICADTNRDRIDELYILQDENGRSTVFRYMLDSNRQVTRASVMNSLSYNGTAYRDISTIDFADLDGDGVPELILFSVDHPSTIVCRHEESRYVARSVFSLENTILGNSLIDITKNDADGDGMDDIIVVPFDGTIRLLTNASGQIEQRQIGNLTSNAIHDAVVVLDLDRDNKRDLLVLSRQTGGGDSYEQLSVVCGENPGEFKNAVTFVTRRPSSPYSNLRLGSIDLNRDGWEDVVFMDDVAQELVFLTNHSTQGASAVINWFLH